jgi:hypothetical protein
MMRCLTHSFSTSLCQGGVGGTNRDDRRLWRSVALVPKDGCTDTARPAARS